MGTIQNNNLQSVSTSRDTELSYLDNIVDKKVKKIALTCFESLVDWFLTTFSCCYPAYDRFYQAEVAKLTATNAEEIGRQPVTSQREVGEIVAPLTNQATRVAEAVQQGVAVENGTASIVQVPEDNVALSDVEESDVEEAVAVTQTVPLIPGAKTTSFRRGGTLCDFTTKNIATLRMNYAASNNNEKNAYEFVALYSFKVLLKGDPTLDRNNYFDLKNEKDTVSVKEFERPGVFAIEEYDSVRNITQAYIVDTTKLYLRTYTGEDGLLHHEHVFVTDSTDTSDANYLTLVKTRDPSIEGFRRVQTRALDPTNTLSFASKGKLYDYTEKQIVGLRKNSERNPTEDKFENVTLDSFRVLISGSPNEDWRIGFSFKKDTDKVDVCDFADGVVIDVDSENAVYYGYRKFLVDRKQLYLRTYTTGYDEASPTSFQFFFEEHVYATDNTRLTYTGYLTPIENPIF